MLFQKSSKPTTESIPASVINHVWEKRSSDLCDTYGIDSRNESDLFRIAVQAKSYGYTSTDKWSHIKGMVHGCNLRFTPSVANYITGVWFAIEKAENARKTHGS